MSFLENKISCPKCGETKTLDECLDAGEPLCGIADGFNGVAYGFLNIGKGNPQKAYCATHVERFGSSKKEGRP